MVKYNNIFICLFSTILFRLPVAMLHCSEYVFLVPTPPVNWVAQNQTSERLSLSLQRDNPVMPQDMN